MDNFTVEGDTFAYPNKQYDRLVSQLEQFKCLESLKIYKATDEKLQDFDSTISKCNKLTSLSIHISNSPGGIRRNTSKINLKEIII